MIAICRSRRFAAHVSWFISVLFSYIDGFCQCLGLEGVFYHSVPPFLRDLVYVCAWLCSFLPSRVCVVAWNFYFVRCIGFLSVDFCVFCFESLPSLLRRYMYSMVHVVVLKYIVRGSGPPMYQNSEIISVLAI